MFLIQLSVVLSDKLDTTILRFALPDADPFPQITRYWNVSKPFLQIRQTGWTLAYLVMPAVASLVAARDHDGLERIKYDGSRFLVGLLLPVTLLAAIYAGPFLNFWVGPQFEKDAGLLRLFLVATAPLVFLILSQMALGLGKIDTIAVSALLGALVNLPLSWFLTRRIGVSGVIWGTVLTTLVSNGLIPGIYLFRLLKVDARVFLTRTLERPARRGRGAPGRDLGPRPGPPRRSRPRRRLGAIRPILRQPRRGRPGLPGRLQPHEGRPRRPRPACGEDLAEVCVNWVCFGQERRAVDLLISEVPGGRRR